MNSIKKTDVETELLKLCDLHLGPHGFRALDVDVRIAGKSLVRVFIESADGKSGVSIDDCAKSSRLLGPVIEAGNLVPGVYDLEVSSPGLERRLRTFEDFSKVVGSQVRLKLVTDTGSLKGPVVSGQLIAAEEDGISVKQPGVPEKKLPFCQVRQANLIWNFQGEKRSS